MTSVEQAGIPRARFEFLVEIYHFIWKKEDEIYVANNGSNSP